ncbi:MAG: zinc ribbon domain-containing protein, partial [Halobacteriales archaeon]|nr:zinc ribbon domain-containing protein [Halobacteriales archaeon]
HKLGADAVAHAAGADAQPSLGSALAKALPKSRLARAGQLVGDGGSTAPLLGLAAGLEAARAGESLVLAHAGAGRAIALAWECEAKPAGHTLAAELAEHVEDLDAARTLRLRGALGPSSDVSQGAAISRASWLESLPARLRFEGQRCASGHVQFPPRAACAQCGSPQLAPHRLQGTGEVHSVTTIGRGSAPAEFAEQQRRMGSYDVAIVQLAEGPRVAAMLTGPAGQARIGDAVELVVRKLYTQDGAPRYGFKARGASPGPGAQGPSASEPRAGPGAR